MPPRCMHCVASALVERVAHRPARPATAPLMLCRTTEINQHNHHKCAQVPLRTMLWSYTLHMATLAAFLCWLLGDAPWADPVGTCLPTAAPPLPGAVRRVAAAWALGLLVGLVMDVLWRRRFVLTESGGGAAAAPAPAAVSAAAPAAATPAGDAPSGARRRGAQRQ